MSIEDLCNAILSSDVEFVLRLLRAGTSPNEKCSSGDWPLVAAIRVGKVEVIRLLLKAGADVGATVKEEKGPWSPRIGVIDRVMLDAGRFDERSGLELLLNAGLNVNYRMRNGQTLLIQAIDMDLELTSYLLSRGADPNLAMGDDWTPLMQAVSIDLTCATPDALIRQVQQLLHAGANAHARNVRGETPRDVLERQVLADEDTKRIVRRLLDGGIGG